MPACIPEDARADVLRFTLCSVNMAFGRLPGLSATQIAGDQSFWLNFKNSIADSLNQVELYELLIENVLVLEDGVTATGQNTSRLWIAFKVRAENHTAVSYWLSEQQALTKARLQSSLQARVPGLQVSSMVLTPPRLAVQYGSFRTVVQKSADIGFFDRLVDDDDSDSATILLGCIVGIMFGLVGVAVCCRRGRCARFVYDGVLHRRYEESNENDDNPNAPLSPLRSPAPLSPGSPGSQGGGGPPAAAGSPKSKESEDAGPEQVSRDRNPVIVVGKRLRQRQGQCVMQ